MRANAPYTTKSWWLTWCFLFSLVMVRGLYTSSYGLVCCGSTLKVTGPLQYSPSMTGVSSQCWLVRLGMEIILTSRPLTCVEKFCTSLMGGMPVQLPVSVNVTGLWGPPSKKHRNFWREELKNILLSIFRQTLIASSLEKWKAVIRMDIGFDFLSCSFLWSSNILSSLTRIKNKKPFSLLRILYLWWLITIDCSVSSCIKDEDRWISQ